MIKKINDISGRNYQYIVVGSGPAGITFAINAARENKKVLLVEGGGWGLSEESQQNYNGKVIGDSAYSLKRSRLRFFGGTSNHWAGVCRPLDSVDFKQFPIDKKDLDPYISKACSILEITGEEFNKDKSINRDFKQIHFEYSPPVRFNKKYRKTFEKSEFIDLVLNTSILEIVESKQVDGLVEFIRVSDSDKNIFNIGVNKLIIACGGIENSRILLWSQHINRTLFSGLKIGKGWMEHPHYAVGDFIMFKSEFNKIFSGKNIHGQIILQPTDAVIKDNNIGNAGIRIQQKISSTSVLKNLVRDVLCVNPEYGSKLVELFKKDLICGSAIYAAWEQKPIEENKIELDFDDKDDHNIPRIKLYWKVNDDDIRTILVCMNKLGVLFINKDIGRVGVGLHLETDKERNGFGCCFLGGHHMGGTPMGVSPKNCVVDKDLKVFNVHNMWVLGSSVFPSAGHANPTFTIVQLSLRLADYFNNNL